jgi:sugar-specific transcriptional regulator TrmB
MNIKDILHQLGENFGLKKNQITILYLLYTHEKLTADEIVLKSKIPKGGIYEYLNELLNLKLISKEETIPAKYEVDNFKQRILEFLHFRFEDFMKKESEILSMIDKNDIFDFQLIKSKEEYTFQMMDIVTNALNFDCIIRDKSVPFELYPDKEEDFLKLRKILWEKRPTLSGAENQNLTLMLLKVFREAWIKKKKLRYIITKSGLDYYFNTLKDDFRDKTKEEMSFEILKRLSKIQAEIKVIEDNIPYSLFLSDKKVMFIVAQSTKIINGFVSTNKDIIEIYRNLFESMYIRNKPIESIEKYLKEENN